MKDKFFLTIIAALAIWAIKVILSHIIRRSRFRGGLIADINMHIDGVKEQRGAVKILVEDTVIKGQKLPFPISYITDQYSYYNSFQKELPLYLYKSELIKVINY